MAKTNAQRQREYRQRRKNLLKKLEQAKSLTDQILKNAEIKLTIREKRKTKE